MNSIALNQKKYRRRSDKLLVILTALCILFLNGVHCVEVGDSKQQKIQDKKEATTNTAKDSEGDETTRKLYNVFGNQEPDIGPWPECVGWFSSDCSDYIQSETTDTVKIGVVRPPPVASDGSGRVIGDPHRVQVRVDEYNVVVAVPQRG